MAGTAGSPQRLGRPAATVRGWLRRFAARVEAVRVVFTLRRSGAGAGSGAARPGRVRRGRTRSPRWRGRGGRRFARPGSPSTVPVWQVACAVSAGRLLAPGWPAPTDQC